ncbi:hypothetical protein [Klebsiella pneumoniae]|uniref:hypothetical protein n=1 Tax=Klebsiella pneumoniae TaxID=573 RepID=UPI003D02F682
MKLTTLLKKHFDIEEITDVDSTVNREVYTIWVYEKGEDCEPLLILKMHRILWVWMAGLSGISIPRCNMAYCYSMKN